MVSVVLPHSPELSKKKSVDHVPHKEGLPTPGVGLQADVGKQLPLQDPSCPLETLFLLKTHSVASPADVVEALVLVMVRERILKGGLQQIHHVHVVRIINDSVHDVSVCHHPESSEQHTDRNVLPHVGDRCHNLPKVFALSSRLLLPRVPQLDGKGSRRLPTLRHTSDLAHPCVFRISLFLEQVHKVVCHSLLSNEDLLTPVDHEVPSLIEGALLQFRQMFGVISVQPAEVALQHHGNLSD
mmetsp:Transcript_55569/g.108821  ORF Transcript_55569/g.108821 Transcript_55569/m.108821 type:complete len:241 (-) Transcript_55569:424-1146(-)